MFVVVSGPPASGKSTLAPPLARRLGLPLIAKDVIKDAILGVVPVVDLEESRLVGRASVAALLAVARTTGDAVLESVWHRSAARDDLAGLGGPLVEVFCRCDRPTLAARYRARSGSRGAGHFDTIRTADELWNAETSEPVAGGWLVIEVDTTQPVDLDLLVREIRAAVVPVEQPPREGR